MQAEDGDTSLEYPLNPALEPGQDALLRHAARIAQLDLPRRPRLPSWLALHDLGDDRLQLVSPSLSYTLTHPLFIETFRAIAPLLDGTLATEELLQATAGIAEPSTTLFLLKMLFAHGILYEGDLSQYPPAAPAQSWRAIADFFADFTPTPAAAIANVAKARITLAMPDNLARVLEGDLQTFGFTNTASMDTSAASFVQDLDAHLHHCAQAKPLVVVALHAPQRNLFGQINVVCLNHETRWLHIDGDRSKITLGPTFVPHQTACYTCYRNRLASHVPYRLDPGGNGEFIHHAKEHGETFLPLWRVALAQAAMECARLLTGFASPITIGRCHDIDGTGGASPGLEVLKLPRCPSCGVPYAIDEIVRHAN